MTALSSISKKQPADDPLIFRQSLFKQTEPLLFSGHEGLPIDAETDGLISIDRRTADAVALAIGEFTVNSSKYGAIKHGGTVSIRAQVSGGLLELSWRETSNAEVVSTSREGGQGLNIINRMLAANEATLHVQWRNNGIDAKMVFGKGFVVEGGEA